MANFCNGGPDCKDTSPHTHIPGLRALFAEAKGYSLPTNSAARKNVPLARGVLDYFPAALAAVAELSKSGNDKHNPGEDLHWARGKSTDHADCIARHLVDRGTIDPEDGKRHSTKTAWRALALLQEELEEQEGAPIPRGARVPVKECPDNGCVASRPEPSQCDYPVQPIGGYFAGKPCPNLNCYFCRPSRFA